MKEDGRNLRVRSGRRLPAAVWLTLACLGLAAAVLACSSSPLSRRFSTPRMVRQFAQTVRPPTSETTRLLQNASILRNLGRTHLAVKELEEALRREPDNVKVVDALAQCYEDLGDFPRAQALYEAALARHPSHPALRNNLCFSYYQSGQWEKAESCFRETLRLHPENTLARNNLGLLLVRTGRQAEALSLWQEREGEQVARERLAQALASLGLPSGAAAASRAEKTSPPATASAPPAAAAAPAPKPAPAVAAPATAAPSPAPAPVKEVAAAPAPPAATGSAAEGQGEAPSPAGKAVSPPPPPRQETAAVTPAVPPGPPPSPPQSVKTAPPVPASPPPASPAAAPAPAVSPPPPPPPTPEAQVARARPEAKPAPPPAAVAPPPQKAPAPSGAERGKDTPPVVRRPEKKEAGSSPASVRPGATPVREAPPSAQELLERRLVVLNGNGRQGMARKHREWLEMEGFSVAAVGNHRDFGEERTTISYRRPARSVARLLARSCYPQAVLKEAAELPQGAAILVVLGRDQLRQEARVDRRLAKLRAVAADVAKKTAPAPAAAAGTPSGPTPAVASPPTGVTPSAAAPPKPLSAAELVGTRISLKNGNGTPKIARTYRDLLTRQGFTVAEIGNHIDFGMEQTTIFYRPEAARVAQALAARFFPQARLQEAPRLEGLEVKVVLGKDLGTPAPLFAQAVP